MAGCLVVAPAAAEVVERHLPPPPQATTPALPALKAPAVSDNDTPLGANLKAIVLLGPSDPLGAPPQADVMVSTALPRLRTGAARLRLAGFVGKPLSKALISQIEAVIVTLYRKQGFPFVSVTTPEQEIGGGVLRIRVIEFRLGALNIAGARTGEAAAIRRGIRQAPGEPINAPRLSQDLDWLGRYPYRVIEPAFTPGAALGESDLDLSVTQRRPWQVQAGWSNSGAQPSDQDRWFVGGTVGGLVVPQSLLSVLVTGSPDFWVSDGDVFGQPHPAYESVAGRLTAPVAPRQDIELSIDAVETNQPVQVFVTREQTLEATLLWRSAISNFAPAPGDVRLGLEVQSQRRMTFFGGTEVTGGGVNIYQIVAGWSGSWTDALGRSSLDAALHAAPGGIDALNTNVALADFTGGRATSAAYAYADLAYSRTTPIWRGIALASDLAAQYAGRPLPDSQQIAVGGAGAVRGYYLDAGAFDDAVVLRDTLRAPSLAVVKGGPATTEVGPFLFVDLGEGRNEATRRDLGLASIGAGADLSVTKRLSADLTLAYPLVSAPYTPAGDWRLEASVTLAY